MTVEYIGNKSARGFIRKNRIEGAFSIKVHASPACELAIMHQGSRVFISFSDRQELEHFIDQLQQAAKLAYEDGF